MPAVYAPSTCAKKAELDTFHLVFVCTGNRFRSPLAAALLKRAVSDPRLRLASRGVLALGPIPPLPEAVEHAVRFGVDLSSHRAASIGPGALVDADLVLGFEGTDVIAAVLEGGARRERAFTLGELVVLIDDAALPSGDLATRARAARDYAHRSRSGRGDLPQTLEITDPLGEPAAVQRKMADRINALVSTLAGRLVEGPS